MSSGQKEQQPDSSHAAIMIFIAPLVKQVSTSEVRLPPEYVGVRRVRPSSHMVRQAMVRQNSDGATKQSTKTSQVTFTTRGENGDERRMTKQEKKALKYQLAVEKKEAKKKRKLDEIATVTTTVTTTTRDSTEKTQTNGAKRDEKASPSLPEPITGIDAEGTSTTSYHNIEVDPATLEQELAELRGERNGVAPVVLSRPMALQAMIRCADVLSCNDNFKTQADALIQYDECLTQNWANALKASMCPAEHVRQQEDMRPMAYQLAPEPWNRLRPAASSISETKLETIPRYIECGDEEDKKKEQPGEDEALQTEIQQARDWVSIIIRPPVLSFDSDVSIVFEFLYRQTPFYVSCGAKFGCDFLLYDGPRDERHAFAGLRIFSSPSRPARNNTQGIEPISETPELPLPTAYTMAGYVRCLNTAGKLALIATVVRDRDDTKSLYRICFVDLALEKILSAPTHQRRARTTVRRDVSQNLAKK
jgi:hypothetical protein